MTKEMTVQKEKALELRSFMFSDRTKSSLREAIPERMQKWLSADRILRIVFSEAMKNPTLLKCSPESILKASMACAQLGLEPIEGRAYLVPYCNSRRVNGQWVKVWEVQMQVGYRGLIQMAKNSGVVDDLSAEIVFAKDPFKIQLGTDRKLWHEPYLDGDRGAPRLAYAVWFLKGNIQHFDFMTLDQIYKRREASQSYQFAKNNPENRNAQDCPWIKWPEEMMLKTVIKWSSKKVPASIDIMAGIEDDDDEPRFNPISVGPVALDAGRGPAKLADDLAGEFDSKAEYLFAGDPVGLEAFHKYAERSAELNEKTIDEYKNAIMRADDFDGFRRAFEKVAASDPGGQGGQDDPGGQGNPGGSNLSEAHPLHRNKWINKREKGLREYVDANFGALGDLDMETFKELSEKWVRVYDEPFPYDPDGSPINFDGADGSGAAEGNQSGNRQGDDMGQGENVRNNGSDDVEKIFNSREATALSILAKRWPDSYREVVGGKKPVSIDQLREWIQAIEDVAAFSGEKAKNG
jgi:recombination protein RecT